MRFQFEGEEYQVLFRHDPPLDWASHKLHEIEFKNHVTRLDSSVAQRKAPYLVCSTCSVKLGGNVDVVLYASLRRARRERGTTCLIVRVTAPAVKGKRGPKLEAVAVGRSRLNVKAGDQFTREGGRRASLEDALHGDVNDEFRAAVRHAYNNRGPMRSAGGQ